jgi:hypothetical protein
MCEDRNPTWLLKSKHPPGRTNCEIERNAATGSGRYIRIKRPTAASRTRCPRPTPASRKNLSVMEATRAACRMRRSCSASVLPNGYLVERWLVVIVTKDVTSFDFISQYPYLFASDNGNGQNFGGASVPMYTDGASMNQEIDCKLRSNSS